MPVRLALALALAITLAAPARGQQPFPRTADGHPDFSGVWMSSFSSQVTERPQGATKQTVSDEEAAKLVAMLMERRKANRPAVYDPDDDTIIVANLPRVGGELRTSLVTDPADGKLPLTAGWRSVSQQVGQAMQRHGQGQSLAQGPEELPFNERCFGGAGRAPLSQAPIPVLRQLVQTSGHLVIYTETLFGETRIAGIGAEPRPKELVSFFGDSVARWDGDELVVETTGTSDEKPVRLGGVVVRAAARVIERFHFSSADTILYRFTVEDPGVYTAPWSAEFEMHRTDERTFESACHEGNYGLSNILRGARETEKRPAKPEKPKASEK